MAQDGRVSERYFCETRAELAALSGRIVLYVSAKRRSGGRRGIFVRNHGAAKKLRDCGEDGIIRGKYIARISTPFPRFESLEFRFSTSLCASLGCRVGNGLFLESLSNEVRRMSTKIELNMALDLHSGGHRCCGPNTGGFGRLGTDWYSVLKFIRRC